MQSSNDRLTNLKELIARQFGARSLRDTKIFPSQFGNVGDASTLFALPSQAVIPITDSNGNFKFMAGFSVLDGTDTFN